MAVNFCHPALNSAIMNEPVCTDTYEVSNLLSPEWSKRNRGFLSEFFIKPPVDIVIKFTCCIELSHVILYCKVGTQLSSGFEILTEVGPVNTKEAEAQNISDAFNLIGKAFCDNGEEKVCYVNKSFLLRPPFGNGRVAVDTESATIMKTVGHYMAQSLTRVNHLKIRIIKTLNSTVPCLRGVEVWGQPSKNVPVDIVNSIYKVWSELIIAPSVIQKNLKETTEDTKVRLEGKLDDSEIPSEFIDPISCEVMSVPLLLPSGQSIDKSTLDKYVAAEAVWGRSANDPFTGVCFRNGVSPLPNPTLKSRIDQFLLKNSHLATNLGRTVGKQSDSQISCLVKPQTAAPTEPEPKRTRGKKLNALNKTEEKKCIKRKITRGKSLSNQCKKLRAPSQGRKKRTQKKEQATKKKEPKEVETLPVPKLETSSEPTWIPETTLSSHNSANIEVDHETQLTDSLNSALLSVIGPLQSFTKTTKSKWSDLGKKSNIACSECSSELNLFQLPCSHKICRQCLTSKTSKNLPMECYICKEHFTKSQPIRIHQ